MTNWISTGKANALMDIGIKNETFREKFRGIIPYTMTPGGQLRWDEDAVRLAKNGWPSPMKRAG